MIKKLISILLVIAMTAALTACSSKNNTTPSSSNKPSGSSSAASNKTFTGDVPKKPAYKETSAKESRTNDALGFQFELPKSGEEIAVLHTSMGDIKARLFPDSAPIAVTNFKALVESGYYNGITFHRVINDFMIQGGDPTATGTGGQSVWGEGFEYETNANLLHYIGALSMAHSNMLNSNGSQFFIVQGKKVTESELKSSGYDAYIREEAKQLYYEHGGFYSLDGLYSVFGQVFEGLDVVNAIAGVQTGTNDKPVTDVVINSAEIVKYTG